MPAVRLPLEFVDDAGNTSDTPSPGLPCTWLKFFYQVDAVSTVGDIIAADRVRALIDTGASDIIISDKLIAKFRCPISKTAPSYRVNDDLFPRSVYKCSLYFEEAQWIMNAEVIPDNGLLKNRKHDIILGMSFLRRCNLLINGYIGSSSLMLVEMT